MKSNILLFFSLCAVILLVAACAEKSDDKKTTYISGTITVDQELDRSNDYSGIHLYVPAPNRMAAEKDTLFHAVTDSTGSFSGIAEIDRKDIFSLIVSRNQNTFGVVNMVFADGDSITFNAELPNVQNSATVSSNENDVYNTFNRVDRNFSRVAQFISAGAITGDSIRVEINKWSDIYWELYEENPGTYAAQLAGETSLSMLQGVNDSLMLARTERVLDDYNKLLPSTKQVLLNYKANEGGLDNALSFLDRLRTIAPYQEEKISVEIERIELLFDSSRTEEATNYLMSFKEQFSSDSIAMDWAESIRFDLEYLSPGAPFPSFEYVSVTGDTISSYTLENKPFLIEITRLDNQMYQQQYDRTIAIYQIYRNFGLEIVTVPLGATPVMFEAFFEERDMFWNFIQPNSFDSDDLIEQLNINRLPTRFLVNSDGTIIRRYVGNEYQDVVRGLQQLTTQN